MTAAEEPTTGSTGSTGGATVRAAFSAILGFAPVVAFAPVFGRQPGDALAEPAYLGPVAGAALVPAVACLVVAAATRLPPVTRLTIGLAALAGYVTLVLPAPVIHGPYRLLTSVPPVEPAGAELAAVALVVGLATLGAVEPALRRRGPLWSLPAPLAGVVAGLVLGAPIGVVPWLPPVLALLCGVLLAGAVRGGAVRGGAVRGGRAAGTAPGGARLLAGAALAAMLAVTATAGLLGPTLLAAAGDPSPFNARDLVSQQVRPREDTSPLSRFPALRSGKLSLRLSVTADRPPDRLRYATLDHFTGTYWTTNASYWRAGRELPAPEPAVTGEVVRERVQVTEPGPLGWLVSAGRPLEVSQRGLGVDRASGDVVLPDDRPVPREYEVRSVVPRPDFAALVSDPPVAAADRAALPPTLVATATRIVGDRSGYRAVRRLADYFARDGEFTVDSSAHPTAGHGLLQINRLLATRHGTAEQYASAFAVLVRALGYDARVVVGFRAGEADSRGRYPVTGRDVDAWAEVRFTGAGWVPFLVTPGERADEAPAEPTPQPEEPTPDPGSTPAGSATAARPPDGRRGAGTADGSPAVPGYLPLAVAVLVVLLVVPPGAKAAVRARRRRAPEPRHRVFGAWRDTLDRYAEAGLPASAAATTREIADQVADRFPAPAEPTRDLARLVDAAAYAPAGVGAAEAERAWILADQARRRLRGSLSRPRRLLTTVTPPRHRVGRGAVGRGAVRR